MNSSSLEQSIKRVLSSSNRLFYPSSAIWLSCNNYTYSPHSNECGIRTLLALMVQAIHPSPHVGMLLPYMHGNLAQVGRAWVAICILRSHIPPEPLHDIISDPTPVTFLGPTAISTPASIVQWSELHSPSTMTSSLEPKGVSNLSDASSPDLSPRKPSACPVHPGKLFPSFRQQTLNPLATPYIPSSDKNCGRPKRVLLPDPY
jgi:hypothetical protein